MATQLITTRQGRIVWASNIYAERFLERSIWELGATPADRLHIQQAFGVAALTGDMHVTKAQLSDTPWPGLTRMKVSTLNDMALVVSIEPAAKLLSKREIEVLQLVCDGLSGKEIADALKISEATVATHRMAIGAKTGAMGIAHMMRWAILNGLYEVVP